MSPAGLDLGGQPLLVQTIAGLIIGLGTLLAAYKGYKRRVEREPPGAATTVLASIPDMSAIRHLSDVCTELSGCVRSLERTIEDLVHHERNHVEAERDLAQKLVYMPELCARLRELREAVDSISR